MACYLPNAYAHALYVFAQYDGQTLSGKSYYSDMTPAAETYLEVFRSGVSDPVLTGKLTAKAHLSFLLLMCHIQL